MFPANKLKETVCCLTAIPLQIRLVTCKKINIWQTRANIFPQDLMENGERLNFSDNNNEKNIGFLSSCFVGNK